MPFRCIRAGALVTAESAFGSVESVSGQQALASAGVILLT